MSYPCTKADARATIADIELSETHGNGNTSPVKNGADTPGGAANLAKPAHETQIVGRLRHGINKPKTRTDKLTRKYAAS